jgi:hypothetical protein
VKVKAWEKNLMEFSADLLVTFGSSFAEAGLGLGLSALRVVAHQHVTRHTVVELHPEVMRLFESQHHVIPTSLELTSDDFFAWVRRVAPGSLDGIFFDPALPSRIWADASFWQEHMPWIVRAIRVGGAFIPFFSSRPVLREQFLPYFSEIRCYPRPFEAYENTRYTYARSGLAIVQCFIKVETET